MSLGFARVAPGDWDKLKKGSRADTVEPGDYIGKLVGIRHIDPEKNKNGIGTYIVAFELGAENDDEWIGKKVEHRSMYHPDPDNSKKPEGYVTMNGISQQNIVQLIDASNAEPVTSPDGMFDIIQTLTSLPELQPLVAFTVSHGTDNSGRPTQDVERFRPVA